MNVDREHIVKKFASYVQAYDDTDSKIKLKIDHTYRVSMLCEQLAESAGLSEEDVRLSWLSGMLHDIGRFEQIRRFNTFNDAKSVDHAQFGANLLFFEGLIREFLKDDREDALLEKVIRLHNAYRLPEELSEREYALATILRDADKIDILKVNVEVPMEEIYNVSLKELKGSPITDAVYENFFLEQATLRSLKKHPVDHLIGHISLVYELVYPMSYELVEKQGYLEKMMNFVSENEETNERLEKIREKMHEYLARKHKEKEMRK